MIQAETNTTPRNKTAVNRPAGSSLLEAAASLKIFFLKHSYASTWLDRCLLMDPLGAWAHPLVVRMVLSCSVSIITGI